VIAPVNEPIQQTLEEPLSLPEPPLRKFRLED
jgi:hypothetical protein